MSNRHPQQYFWRMKLELLKIHPDNPRFIRDEKYKLLVQSIADFPKMMDLRPIVYDPQTMYILGGNMRYRALKELMYKEIPDNWVKSAADLTEDEKRRFLITDNAGFGQWDFDKLANEWDAEELISWGVDLPDMTIQEDEPIEPKESEASMKILFPSAEELQKAHPEIEEVISRLSKDAKIKISL